MDYKKLKGSSLASKAGRYIVSPHQEGIHRCGAAGLTTGTLYGRCMKYDANWFAGGTIHGFLQLPRHLVKHYEREYHARLRRVCEQAKPREW